MAGLHASPSSNAAQQRSSASFSGGGVAGGGLGGSHLPLIGSKNDQDAGESLIFLFLAVSLLD